MKTLCYYIEYKKEEYNNFLKSLDFMLRLVPCFISLKDAEMNFVELTVICEEEDVCAIQTIIAPYL